MSQKKKFLIMSMTSGFGHIRAGEALLEYAKENLPNIDIEHVDIIDIEPSLKKYVKIYDIISKKLPFIWASIYKYSFISSAIKKAFFVKGLFKNKIKSYIYEKKPDAIIFTNVSPLPLFISDCRKMLKNVKMGILVTDYYVHPYYYFSGVDYYFVANQQVGKDLENMGVKKEKVVITGIPINPRFYVKKDINSLKLKYGIKNDLPVVLFIASFRISKNDLIWVVRQLLEFKPKINLVFIANGNQEFYNMIKDHFSGYERFLLVNWTNVIDEYINMSDVVISKAGGLTVSECLTLKKPMIIVNPIPGQEEHNAEFIEKNNFGKKVSHVNEIIKILPEIMLLPGKNQANIVPPQNPCVKILQYFI